MTLQIFAQDKPVLGCTEARCTCGWSVYGRDSQQVIDTAMAHWTEHRSVEVEA